MSTIPNPVVSDVFYHHQDFGPRVNLKVSWTGKGPSAEITVLNAKTIDEATVLIGEAESKLRELYRRDFKVEINGMVSKL